MYKRQLFDEFAAATGANAKDLSSFEGLARLSKQYYDWTDSLTPDIEGDGKAFFTADDWFNVAEEMCIRDRYSNSPSTRDS